MRKCEGVVDMKQFIAAILLLSSLVTLSYATHYAIDVKKLAQEYNLHAGTKATVQWERVFSSQRHLKRYKLDKLDAQTREYLKRYLIEHSADSDQPIIPGL